ncbi:DUF4153 domain-containing protein [Mixta calida]|uniref:DUF4153 domain-containing protein n=1 Tax=Mixta calida TaxID=665913 RepID=UPI00403ABDA1
MLQKEVFPESTKWTIIAIGILAGLLWALPAGLHLQDRYAFYLPPLVLSAACVLAFTLYRLNAVKPWLCALLTLPFIALMTGWRRWNFPEMSTGEFQFQNSCAVLFLLILVMPFLTAFCNEPVHKQGKASLSAFITGALWSHTFTVGVTAIMTGLFWLVLMLWSKLFSMIGIKLFEQLFFDNAFFPSMATGAAIAAGIVFCRRLPGAAGMYRHVITLAVNVLLPLHAITSLLFLACLPFTGLSIIPKYFSAATLLLSMTLLMLAFSAIVGEKAPGESRWQRGIARLVLVAQCLTPLLAALAGWALWLRIAEYGWTEERVYGVASALLAFSGSLLLLRAQRRAWSQGAGNMNTFIVLMLVLSACGWFLLHTPVLDPLRISVKNQLARYEQGEAKADTADLYTFSNAGRRGKEMLKRLKAHPQWLKEPAEQQAMLMQILAEKQIASTKPGVSDLQRSIPLRAGSEAPPESWWQSQAQYIDNSLSLCLMDAGSCLVWMQDLNNDGVPEVLLYNRNRPGITVYTRRGEEWRYAGNVTLSKNVDKAIREAMPKAVIKPWRDLEINGQRYPVQYYGFND